MVIDLAQEHQKNTNAKNFWSSQTFSQLMAYSPKEAAKYAISCNIETNIMGMSAKDYVAKCDAEEKTKLEEKKVKNEEAKEKEVSSGLTVEDLRELLKDNNITFHPATGLKRLMLLAKQNNLI